MTCVFSLICALVLAFLDKRAEKILHKEEGKTGTDTKIKSFLLLFVFPVWPQLSIITKLIFAVSVEHNRAMFVVICLKLKF